MTVTSMVTCEWITADKSFSCSEYARTAVTIAPPNRPISMLALCARHADVVRGTLSDECVKWATIEEYVVQGVLES